MRLMETNDWIVLNNIIYKIYTTDDFDMMRNELLSQLKMVFDFDSADYYMATGDNGRILGNAVTYNCDADLGREYEAADLVRGLLSGGKTMVYRETDIAVGDDCKSTDYYDRVYRANNWQYGMQMILCGHNKLLGVITFYRSIGKEDFGSDDIFILNMLKEHLTFRMESHMKNAVVFIGKMTIAEAVKKHHLTKREETVLRLLLQGKENSAICDELSITPNTLKKHILNIYRKLDIRNRVQLFKMIREYE